MGKLISLPKLTDPMPTKQKAELLLHYAGREPKTFWQCDAHDVGVDSIDSVMRPDEDGFSVTGQITDELMYGCAVRVLADPETPLKKALLGVHKVAEWIERDIKRAKPGMTVGQLRAKDYARWSGYAEREAKQAEAELAERGMKLPEITEPPPAPPLPPSFAAWLDGWNDPVLKAAGELVRFRLVELERLRQLGIDPQAPF